jgi:hypothetical protein
LRVELPDDHTVGAPGDIGHAADPEVAARQFEHLVSDEAALWYAQNRALMGTAQEIASRLDDLARSGIAGVTVTGSGSGGLTSPLRGNRCCR